MKCGLPGCDQVAVYRTCGDDKVVSLLCLKHAELAIDKGWPTERLITLRAS